MKFNTDSHFVIGSVHIRQNKPCQDHALDCTQDDGNTAVAVISDGCSSGNRTDIGARVITCSTVAAIESGFDPLYKDTSRFVKTAIIDKMITAKHTLAVNNGDMLATCNYALIDKKGGIIHIMGDGCLAIKSKSGTICITLLEWQQNTPYYPVYSMSPEHVTFTEYHKRFNEGREAMKITDLIVSDEGMVLSESSRFVSLLHAMTGYVHRILMLDGVESIAVFSDGVQDFQKKGMERIPVEKVVHEMMNFKSYTGEFVKRRVSAALKTFAKDDIHPGDDFSMAVIHINEDGEQEVTS